MEPSSLRRKDTTKGRPLRILSLDGGGVRGYSMLILLREFMHQTYERINSVPERSPDDERPEPRSDDADPRPCDYFDLIAGSGTGGLIAIMLGRLRMSIVDCMRVYVDMTRRVFETDKTIAGIPYRSTLFKASKLEDAIRECVRDFEVLDQGETAEDVLETPSSPGRPGTMYSSSGTIPKRSMSHSSARHWESSLSFTHGNPNAYLYDTRPNRTKTAVTAVYKGSHKGDPPALLRSYRSRKKPSPEFKCAIWQAGRATSAIKLAFKPIQIGQSVFLDEGEGMINLDKSPTSNPAPHVLDEVVINEWPGQEVGVFLSIGTGKRPSGTSHLQAEWWESFVGGLGEFAEAKRKLMLKIEGCEKTHEDMLSTHLPQRGVQKEYYHRLNVEVGVGEFGMNEWNRLPDIRNNTELYLNREDVREEISRAADQMAAIEIRKQEHLLAKMTQKAKQFQNYPPASVPGPPAYAPPPKPTPPELPPSNLPPSNLPPFLSSSYLPPSNLAPSNPNAVELPGETPPSLFPRPLSTPGPRYPETPPYSQKQVYASGDKYIVIPSEENYQRSSHMAPRRSNEGLNGSNGDQYRNERPVSSDGSFIPTPPRRSFEKYAPPRPPKTPITVPGVEDTRRYTVPHGPRGNIILPYPDTDGPPPMVNMARKPQSTRR